MLSPEERAHAITHGREPWQAEASERLEMRECVVTICGRLIAEAIREAVLEEREACAELAQAWEDSTMDGNISDLIRARSGDAGQGK